MATHGPPSSAKREAAVKPAEAWPLGKLAVRGVRSRKGRLPMPSGHCGLVRGRSDLSRTFTSADSTASTAASRTRAFSPCSEPMERALPISSQRRLKSPSSDVA